ncbi:helix-turn-helix transcriptional regulator (plasmid) [Deinococcus sp. D7000]|nr:helix-turn-helix transcriptional regulator [Deinococcus sp. D7000]QLG13557.1 helix-turn-helix transcriptional regulator [Deinococcus sp. D7000]
MQELIGQNIRRRRQEAGLTLAQLAERMFDNPERKSYISTVENGQIAIDVARLGAFADALNCPAADLLLTVSHNAEKA